MQLFSGTVELLTFADQFLAERMNALENDVKRCTENQNPAFLAHSQTAPFSALCYCFATIDCLGALYVGDASEHRPSTDQSRKYMEDFMKYPHNTADLLQRIYRHKIVHLAQPDPVFVRNSKRVAWATLTQSSPRDHLKIVPLPKQVNTKILTTKLTLRWDEVFFLSVTDFQCDIKKSVEGSGGYRDTLKVDANLQDNFAKAIREIYS